MGMQLIAIQFAEIYVQKKFPAVQENLKSEGLCRFPDCSKYARCESSGFLQERENRVLKIRDLRGDRNYDVFFATGSQYGNERR